ncbi:MAG: virginiamycin B lyase family protein [Solirubrobacteraceae bacterium]
MLLAAGLAAVLPASASAIQITEFSAGLLNPQSPLGPLTAGADGNVWFVGQASIGRITPSGAITEFTTGLNQGSLPRDVALGADGNVWFTDNGTTKAIGKIAPDGTITEFPAKDQTGEPANIVKGGDGNIWFVNGGAAKKIGKVTPSEPVTVTETPLPEPLSEAKDITLGPDGDLWFTDPGTSKIGRVSPAGEIEEFGSVLLPNMKPQEITAGADGNLWFSDTEASAIGRVTPAGVVEEFTPGLEAGAKPTALTVGPDGNVWFIDQSSPQPAVGRVTPDHVITEFTQGLSGGLPLDIVAAADGNLWVFQGQPGGSSMARVTTAGAITEFTSGLSPTGGQRGGALVAGPDKSLWFTETNTPRAIGKLDLQLPSPSTGSTTTTAGTTTTTQPPATPLPLRTILSLIKATFGNQQVAVTTPLPTACTSASKTLKVTFSSTTIAGSRATKLRFVRVALYLDRGLARRRRVTTTSHGKKKTVTTTVYGANESFSRSPAVARLAVVGLKSGAHTLKVKIAYQQTLKVHGRTRTTTIFKTLTAPFRIC